MLLPAHPVCICDFCFQTFGTRAFKCPVCRSVYDDLRIACESCHEEMMAMTPAAAPPPPAPAESGTYSDWQGQREAEKLERLIACGQAREVLDFSNTTFGVQRCKICEQFIAPGTYWAVPPGEHSAGRDPELSLCVVCADSPAGLLAELNSRTN